MLFWNTQLVSSICVRYYCRAYVIPPFLIYPVNAYLLFSISLFLYLSLTVVELLFYSLIEATFGLQVWWEHRRFHFVPDIFHLHIVTFLERHRKNVLAPNMDGVLLPKERFHQCSVTIWVYWVYLVSSCDSQVCKKQEQKKKTSTVVSFYLQFTSLQLGKSAWVGISAEKSMIVL